MKSLPALSIVIVTLNNQRSLAECLRLIKRQDYPKNKIEYIIIDGGSTDATPQIAKKYGFRFIKSPIRHNAEAQRAIGLRRASHNLIVSLDADNYLPNDQWLRQMVRPFQDDPEVVHANTIYYGYRKTDSVFNRYVGLFGHADPVAYYVGLPDRIPRFQKKWSLGHIIRNTSKYVLVDFDKDSLPTVGCNGVVYRKDILLKYAKSSTKDFLHIDVFADVVTKGYTRFAIVKNDVIHDTAVSLLFLMKKRLAFLFNYYLPKSMKRRYLIYDPTSKKSNFKMFLFIFYTVTFIKPLMDSIRGYLVIRDVAWFVHPLVCYIYLISYGIAAIRKKI